MQHPYSTILLPLCLPILSVLAYFTGRRPRFYADVDPALCPKRASNCRTREIGSRKLALANWPSQIGPRKLALANWPSQNWPSQNWPSQFRPTQIGPRKLALAISAHANTPIRIPIRNSVLPSRGHTLLWILVQPTDFTGYTSRKMLPEIPTFRIITSPDARKRLFCAPAVPSRGQPSDWRPSPDRGDYASACKRDRVPVLKVRRAIRSKVFLRGC